jgi:ribosomal protein S18 acetylase RimI-like enzyme
MIYLDKGYIGCFDMKDKKAGKKQLEEYIRQSIAAGHRRIVAPINGDTWHSYRLVSWTNGAPFFPLEPENPLWYNEVYEELGFKPLMKYRSDSFALGDISLIPNEEQSLRIRNFREDDLKLIYEISLRGFKGNYLYNEITFEKFNRLYQPMLPLIDEELVLIAEVDGVAAGFMFAFGVAGKLVLKSMAVLPEFRSNRVGSKLINQVLVTGQKKGLTEAIAALMSEGNDSEKIVIKYGSQKIREYTLYYLDV